MSPDFDDLLAPLARFAHKDPGLEASVFWADAEAWAQQDDDLLEADEIAFYAEGLLAEGFGMVWQAIAATPDAPRPDHVRMFFWQGALPTLPPLPEGWHCKDSRTHLPGAGV